jgi:hypothetical protein
MFLWTGRFFRIRRFDQPDVDHSCIVHCGASIGRTGLIIQVSGGEFGPDVEPVARRHILSDLEHEGWTENAPSPARHTYMNIAN